MRRPEEILKGCSDDELAKVLEYIQNLKTRLIKEREVEVFNELIGGGKRVKVIRKGKILWTGVAIKALKKNIVVERDDTRMRYRVPANMLEIID